MRVALLHSAYASDQPSGENVVVREQAEALARAGAMVLTLARHTDDERQRPGYPLRAAWRTVSQDGPDPTARLREFRPDVVHVHNTVPNLGTRWLSGWRGPVVHTLHNFRPLCANALLYRDGHTCTLCPDGRPWSAVQYACYRDSAVASLPLALRNAAGLEYNVLLRRADRLVLLSDFAADVYRRYGLPGERVRVVPNGIAALHPAATEGPQQPRFMFVGRLRAEKGIAELVAAWPTGTALDVFGDGPLLDELRAQAPVGVAFHGAVDRAEIRRLLPGASGLVFPSLWPEPAVALVVVEALEAGVPVIAALEGSQTAGLVDAGVARAVAMAGGVDSAGLRDALRWAHDGGPALRQRCRQLYEHRFSEEHWVAALTAVYDEVCADA